jgi:hypothetical protein
MLTIRKTSDYSQFRFWSSNRETHPKYLVESIQKKNMLDSHPILCTKNLYVVDGQNRLKAAEILKVPIYYIVDENIDECDIPTCQVQNPWDLHDFLRYYRGSRDDYQFINDIISSHNIPIHFVVSSCSSIAKPFHAFRNGTYVTKTNKQKLKTSFACLSELLTIFKEINPNMKIGVQALRAIWSLINKKNYDHFRMKEKCKKYKDKVILSFQFKEKANILDSLEHKVYDFFAKKNRSCFEE